MQNNVPPMHAHRKKWLNVWIPLIILSVIANTSLNLRVKHYIFSILLSPLILERGRWESTCWPAHHSPPSVAVVCQRANVFLVCSWCGVSWVFLTWRSPSFSRLDHCRCPSTRWLALVVAAVVHLRNPSALAGDMRRGGPSPVVPC